MGFISYNQLLENYIIAFEKEVNKNRENHPTFSLLKFALRNIVFHSYFIYLVFLIICIFTMIPLMFVKTFDLGFFLYFYFLYLLAIGYILVVIKRKSRYPFLTDLWALEDRITLIRSKIQLFDFELDDIKGMVLETDKANCVEALAYLKRYAQLIKPSIDGNKNKSINIISNPLERLIAFDRFMQFVGINYTKEENTLLLSSILRISSTNFPNVVTDLNILKKMIRKEPLKDTEKEKTNYLTTSFLNAAKLFDENSKDINKICNSLIQSK